MNIAASLSAQVVSEIFSAVPIQSFSRVYSEAHFQNLTYVMLIAKGTTK